MGQGEERRHAATPNSRANTKSRGLVWCRINHNAPVSAGITTHRGRGCCIPSGGGSIGQLHCLTNVTHDDLPTALDTDRAGGPAKLDATLLTSLLTRFLLAGLPADAKANITNATGIINIIIAPIVVHQMLLLTVDKSSHLLTGIVGGFLGGFLGSFSPLQQQSPTVGHGVYTPTLKRQRDGVTLPPTCTGNVVVVVVVILVAVSVMVFAARAAATTTITSALGIDIKYAQEGRTGKNAKHFPSHT
mmetsp:Transcript_20097/g.43851  ORF Transcript_20097/g.43851 Transcript_20097/m.43851 type:complete len:246 (-) Transcript_20097:733-1470(-)